MKIHSTKMSCLNASLNQGQRPAQADKIWGNQSKGQNHIAEEIHCEESDKEFINTKCDKINFQPASAKEQWKDLDSKLVL